MRPTIGKFERSRRRAARSWWTIALAAVVVGLLLGWRFADRWLSTACVIGTVLGLVLLWMIVTIRDDETIDDVVDSGLADAEAAPGSEDTD